MTIILASFRLAHKWRCMEMEYCRSCDAAVFDFYGPGLLFDALGIVVGISRLFWGNG